MSGRSIRQPRTDYEPPHCGDCGAVMVLTQGRPTRAETVRFWACSTFPACRGTHGAHQLTGEPLGKPADAETRQARIAAHAVFDTLWRNGGMTREAAYGWLRTVLFLRREDAHISMLSKEQCAKVVEAGRKMASPRQGPETTRKETGK